MRYFVILLALFFVGAASTQVTSYKAKDSLRATNPLKCVLVEEVGTNSTAADIAVGASKCLRKKRYVEAAELVMLASAFVNFDTRRVVDRSAHMAQQTLFAEVFSRQSQQRMGKLFAQMELLSPGSERHSEICNYLIDLGAPTYFPKYMIAHGMAVFIDSSEPPLVDSFDSEAAWSATPTEFTNCESAN